MKHLTIIFMILASLGCDDNFVPTDKVYSLFELSKADVVSEAIEEVYVGAKLLLDYEEEGIYLRLYYESGSNRFLIQCPNEYEGVIQLIIDDDKLDLDSKLDFVYLKIYGEKHEGVYIKKPDTFIDYKVGLWIDAHKWTSSKECQLIFNIYYPKQLKVIFYYSNETGKWLSDVSLL